MALWTDEIEDDPALLMQEDGEQIKVVTSAGTFYPYVFWQSLSLEGEQGGPRFTIASADIPSGFTQGNTVTRNGKDYVVTHRDPDGHGLEVVTLNDS